MSRREAKKAHERQVCEAIVRLIEFRREATRSDEVRPEDLNRKDESVELAFKIQGIQFVLEHTLIESYPKQIAEHHQLNELVGPLIRSLDGQMPIPGRYELWLHTGAVQGVSGAEKIRAALKEWVLTHANGLICPQTNPSPPGNSIRGRPAGVPFEVTLSRWASLDGRLMLGLYCPPNLEDLRNERAKKALDDKCPKLQTAKGTDGISVLVLEWNDIQLGNCVNISQAVKSQFLGRHDTPDEIYLVDTTIPREEQLVFIFKDQFGIFPDLVHDKPYRIHPISFEVKRWGE